MDDEADRQLVASYLGGDERALEELVRQYTARIYAYARRFTGNADVAADIAQETFVKAWKNLRRYDPAQPFAGWLYTIAKRTAIDWMRKRRESELPDDLADTSVAIPETIDARQRMDALAAAAAGLPARSAAVVQLRLQDLEFHEIAERLGRPLNTVKSQYRRALRTLAQRVHHTAPSGRKG